MQQGRPWTAARRHARRPQSPVVDKLTAFEAARLVGCRTPEVAGLLNGEPATLEAVQRLALEHYGARREARVVLAHHDPRPAEVLGVSVRPVWQFLEREHVPT